MIIFKKVAARLLISGLIVLLGLIGAASLAVVNDSPTGAVDQIKIDPKRVDNVPSGKNADVLLKQGLNAIYLIVGTIAIITIILAGIMYITSDGDAAKAATAKNAILYAVIGLVIVGLAFIITGIVQNIANPN